MSARLEHGARGRRAAAWPLALAALLVGCASPPPKPPPFEPAAVPAAFKEAGPWQRAAAVSADAAVPEDWWRLFDDPVLDELAGRLASGNQDVQVALAQAANARALLRAAQAALLPTLTLDASATRSGGGTRAAAGNPSAAARGGTVSGNDFALTADAAWEVDLWGRLAEGRRAAGARYQASVDDVAAVRLSAQATLVQSYLGLRAAEAQQALLARTAEADQRALELTQARVATGVAAQSDVLQAQTQLRTVQAQIEETAAQRAQLEHAIAVLLGLAPAALDIARTAQLPALPAVPALLPATLLERRPDIAAAERSVATAYAQIGVADAAYFPALTLSASAGWHGAVLGSLVSAPNLLWSLGSALAAPLLDGGARRLASEQARATAEQATATYRQTVLTALQEVEDNLVLLRRLESESALRRDALDAARRNLQIVLDQYRAGTVSFLNVTAAQAAAYTADSDLLALRQRQLVAAGVLLKNLGGRWAAP
jgi:NodT family efflux transporter outer membrane factor (OMF) lipoprotein